MDIGLPGMDGLTATIILKKDGDTSDIPVVATTALAAKADEAKAREAGCDGFLAKPIEAAALYQAIAKAVGPKGNV